MSLAQVLPVPAVTLIDGQPRVSSLDVAEKFGKAHKVVLQAIQRITAELPADFIEHNFVPNEYTDSIGRKLPMYQLTRDGFSLLAMGFTGKKALAWKVRYIEAFNAMEAELLKKSNPTPRQKRPRKALPTAKQLALPAVKKDKFEAYIEQVEAFRARTDAEIRRLLQDGLRLVDVYKFGPKAITGFSGIFLTWLHEVAVSPSPLVAHYWSMDRAIEYSPLYLVREMEKILPDLRRR